MKALLVFFLTVISVHAASIDIGDTGYELDAAPTWELIPNSKTPQDTWNFLDTLSYLGAGVMLFDMGKADGFGAKNLIRALSDNHGKGKEVEPIAGLQTLRFANEAEKTECWVCCIVEEKFTLVTIVSGDRDSMKSREAEVRAFLTGLKKKK